MFYTEEQKRTIKTHIENMKKYIELEILPRIPYHHVVESPDKRYSIEINGARSDKIIFCLRGYPRTIQDLIFFEYAPEFLKNWTHFKQAFFDEIEKQKRIRKPNRKFSNLTEVHTMKKLYYKTRRFFRWMFSREILDAINAGADFATVEEIARRGEV